MSSKLALFLVPILASVLAGPASSQEMPIDKLMMIHMAVRDMDKAKEFYTSKLGFKAVQDYGHGGQHWVSLVLPGGGSSINLTTSFENMKPGTMKLYFSTPDVEAAYWKLKAKGVQPTHEISNDSWGKWFSTADPDGNQVLIVQPPNPQRTP